MPCWHCIEPRWLDGACSDAAQALNPSTDAVAPTVPSTPLQTKRLDQPFTSPMLDAGGTTPCLLPAQRQGSDENVVWETWKAAGSTGAALFSTVQKNLVTAVAAAEAGTLVPSSVAAPVFWDAPERSRAGQLVANQVAGLVRDGFVRDQPLYVVITGNRGVGKTMCMNATMQGIQLSLFGNKPAATADHSNSHRLLQGMLARPLFAHPADPAAPFATLPLVDSYPRPHCIPVPAHLAAVEVLWAHGNTDLPGLRGLQSDYPGVPACLCWNEAAFEPTALDKLSAYLRRKGLGVYVYIDELQTLFDSHVSQELALKWHEQLSRPSYGVRELAVAFSFSGSSTLLPRILGSSKPIHEADAAGLGAVPKYRPLIHDQRIEFVALYHHTTEASFKHLVKYEAWPQVNNETYSRDQLAVMYANRVHARRAASDSSATVQTDWDHAGSAALRGELASSLLGPLYKAIAATLVRHPNAEHRRIFASGNIFDMPGVSLMVPTSEVKRRIEMLAKRNVDPRARELLATWGSAGFANELRLWKERGFLVEKPHMIGFPSTLLTLAGVQHLTQDAFCLDPGVLRTVFAPEGTSTNHYGEAITAAALCEQRPVFGAVPVPPDELEAANAANAQPPPASEYSNLARLLKAYLPTDPSVTDMTRQVVRAVVGTQWTWTDDGHAIQGLATGKAVSALPPAGATLGRLYTPVPDTVGVDLIGLTTTRGGRDVLVGAQVCLSAGASDMRITASKVEHLSASASLVRRKQGEKSALLSALGASFGRGEDFDPVHVMLLVTNRITEASLRTAACKPGSGNLAPAHGIAAILGRDQMGPYWPSPVRVLAHDFGLHAWGAPISNVRELRSLRHTTLSISDDVAHVISPTAQTRTETTLAAAALVRREAEANAAKAKTALAAVLEPVGLEPYAAPLAGEGITVDMMRDPDEAVQQALAQAATIAGLTKPQAAHFLAVCKRLALHGDAQVARRQQGRPKRSSNKPSIKRR